MEEVQRRYWQFCSTAHWAPNINICESSEAYFVCVELAGMQRDDIDVQVHADRLVIQGQRILPYPGVEAGQVRVHHMELTHGPFCREVDLPGDVDADRIAARYRDGILWIELPKRHP